MESKLFYIRCDNCGSEYRINTRGEMNCPFCGSKIYLNDKDFEKYRKTRDEMLVKDKVANDLANSDGDVQHKWNNEMNIVFETATGKPVNIHYFYQYDRAGKTVYVGRTKVAIVYDNPEAVEKIERNINIVEFPSADIKDLAMFFPHIFLKVRLNDGRYLVVYDKQENVYPLALFNKLDPKQVAWMISRMENLGCLFEYNQFDFSQIEQLDIYINPKAHYLYIIDGWENVVMRTPQNYLKQLRVIMKDQMILGRAPKECIEFLDSLPASDAYTDFKVWDDVIEHGFNGHNFHHFTEE